MDKIKGILRGNDSESQDQESGSNQFLDTMSWSWGTRVKGFLICFVLGWVCAFMGTFCLWLPMKNSLVAFAVFFSLGNVISVASTFFLMGPMKQLKKMFEETRLIATIVMIISLLLTLLAAFAWKNKGLCLIFVVIQFFAMLWYSLSFIPYARNAVKGCVSSVMG